LTIDGGSIRQGTPSASTRASICLWCSGPVKNQGTQLLVPFSLRSYQLITKSNRCSGASPLPSRRVHWKCLSSGPGPSAKRRTSFWQLPHLQLLGELYNLLKKGIQKFSAMQLDESDYCVPLKANNRRGMFTVLLKDQNFFFGWGRAGILRMRVRSTSLVPVGTMCGRTRSEPGYFEQEGTG